MIIYRADDETVATSELLRPLRDELRDLSHAPAPSYDALVSPLVDAGELAAAVIDALEPHGDDADPVGEQFVALVDAVADAAEARWRDSVPGTRRALEAAWQALIGCAEAPFPARVQRRVSEGFAFYAVGPELYSEAVREWHARSGARRVVCVGIRAIGVVFAAMAAAALRDRGVETKVITMRPRGHPFDRRVSLGRRLSALVSASREPVFLVIDEGPGLSGSTIASCASALSQLGIADDRIILVPGHAVDPSAFPNGEVRRRWERHQVVVPDFDKVWLTSGRLETAFQTAGLHDIAAGRWRSRYSPDMDAAIDTQHERRKYVAEREDGTAWIKFAGIGRYGRATRARAQQAAAAGWGPRVTTLTHGFMAMRQVEGQPLWSTRTPALTPQRLAQYLAFEGEVWKTGSAVPTTALVEMACTNALWLCGDAAAIRIERLAPTPQIEAVRVDGRQHPHEWVGTHTTATKTDGVEHHDDRFFPGPVDIAWDVAGAIEEWRLGASAERALVDHYVTCSGDTSIGERLPFYRAAYLAFRGGYATYARDQLHSTPDGPRFALARDHYRDRLAQVLSV